MNAEAHNTVNITVNGAQRAIPADTALISIVADVTTEDSDSDPSFDQLGIAVALNATVIPRSQWATTTVTSGAEIEIITAMQGG